MSRNRSHRGMSFTRLLVLSLVVAGLGYGGWRGSRAQDGALTGRWVIDKTSVQELVEQEQARTAGEGGGLAEQLAGQAAAALFAELAQGVQVELRADGTVAADVLELGSIQADGLTWSSPFWHWIVLVETRDDGTRKSHWMPYRLDGDTLAVEPTDDQGVVRPLRFLRKG